MNQIVRVVRAATAASKAKPAGEEIKSRHSKELVFALSGPVGCGLNLVNQQLEAALKAHAYEVVVVRISASFKRLATSLGISPPPEAPVDEFARISQLQDLGNALRLRLGDDVGAQIAMRDIIEDRVRRHKGEDVENIKPGRVAYIIDQLKNPKEVSLLRSVYGNLFFSVGVLASYSRRKLNLSASMPAESVEKLIQRDWAEVGGGQQLEKTLKLADYFVRNQHNNSPALKEPIERLVELIHGKNGITPTVNERGMYAAYSAGLRSACLSRQVGASIVDEKGKIVSTGCNDVPRAGGGLYEAGTDDHRCVFQGVGLCHNDSQKDKLRDDIKRLLTSGGIEEQKAIELAKSIRTNTRLKDLIEFSRAVHAEMDALISAARAGGNGVDGCVLFTTTYPCHNCARHIVAAGIRGVYFIEPYGKSLAVELHEDSIDHDADSVPAKGAVKKVAFMHFEGVAPRRFSDLFYAVDSRKDEAGRALQYNVTEAQQSAPELLDNYQQLEAKMVARIRRAIDEAAEPRPDAG